MAYKLTNNVAVAETKEINNITSDVNNKIASIGANTILNVDSLITSYTPDDAIKVYDNQIIYNKSEKLFYKAHVTADTSLIPFNEQKTIKDTLTFYHTIDSNDAVYYSRYTQHYYYSSDDTEYTGSLDNLKQDVEQKYIQKQAISAPYTTYDCPVYITASDPSEIYYYPLDRTYYYVNNGEIFNGGISTLIPKSISVQRSNQYTFFIWGDDVIYKDASNNKYYYEDTRTEVSDISAHALEPLMERARTEEGYLLFKTSDDTLVYYNSVTNEYVYYNSGELYKNVVFNVTYELMTIHHAAQDNEYVTAHDNNTRWKKPYTQSEYGPVVVTETIVNNNLISSLPIDYDSLLTVDALTKWDGAHVHNGDIYRNITQLGNVTNGNWNAGNINTPYVYALLANIRDINTANIAAKNIITTNLSTVDANIFNANINELTASDSYHNNITVNNNLYYRNREFNTIITGINNNIANTASNISSYINSQTNALNYYINTTTSNINTVINTKTNAINNYMFNMYDNINAKTNMLTNEVTALHESITLVNSYVNNQINSTYNYTNSQINNMYNYINTSIADTANSINNNILNTSSNTYNYINTKIQDVNDKINSVNSVISNVNNYTNSTFVPKSAMGVADGVATLDASGRVPYEQLPIDDVVLKGDWDVATNTPDISSLTPTKGDMYIVSVGGTSDITGELEEYHSGDRIIYSGTTWVHVLNGAVFSVNNKTGEVILMSPDLQHARTFNKLYSIYANQTTYYTTSNPGVDYGKEHLIYKDINLTNPSGWLLDTTHVRLIWSRSKSDPAFSNKQELINSNNIPSLFKIINWHMANAISDTAWNNYIQFVRCTGASTNRTTLKQAITDESNVNGTEYFGNVMRVFASDSTFADTPQRDLPCLAYRSAKDTEGNCLWILIYRDSAIYTFYGLTPAASTWSKYVVYGSDSYLSKNYYELKLTTGDKVYAYNINVLDNFNGSNFNGQFISVFRSLNDMVNGVCAGYMLSANNVLLHNVITGTHKNNITPNYNYYTISSIDLITNNTIIPITTRISQMESESLVCSEKIQICIDRTNTLEQNTNSMYNDIRNNLNTINTNIAVINNSINNINNNISNINNSITSVNTVINTLSNRLNNCYEQSNNTNYWLPYAIQWSHDASNNTNILFNITNNLNNNINKLNASINNVNNAINNMSNTVNNINQYARVYVNNVYSWDPSTADPSAVYILYK